MNKEVYWINIKENSEFKVPINKFLIQTVEESQSQRKFNPCLDCWYYSSLEKIMLEECLMYEESLINEILLEHYPYIKKNSENTTNQERIAVLNYANNKIRSLQFKVGFKKKAESKNKYLTLEEQNKLSGPFYIALEVQSFKVCFEDFLLFDLDSKTVIKMFDFDSSNDFKFEEEFTKVDLNIKIENIEGIVKQMYVDGGQSNPNLSNIDFDSMFLWDVFSHSPSSDKVLNIRSKIWAELKNNSLKYVKKSVDGRFNKNEQSNESTINGIKKEEQKKIFIIICSILFFGLVCLILVLFWKYNKLFKKIKWK